MKLPKKSDNYPNRVDRNERVLGAHGTHGQKKRRGCKPFGPLGEEGGPMNAQRRVEGACEVCVDKQLL